MRARFLVVGDGEAGVALASLLPGALLAPSSAPRADLSARGVPVPAGPRYLHAGEGGRALSRAAGLLVAPCGRRASEEREVRFCYGLDGGEAVEPRLAPASLRDAYWRKSRPGEDGPPPASAASAGAESLTALRGDYWEALRLLRERLSKEGRLLPYAAPPRDPDPEVPWRHPDAPEAPERVLYTCPPSALWPGFAERALDKAFLLSLPFGGALLHWPGQVYEYSYRAGAEVPWHRETLVVSGGEPAVVLEWTLPAGHALTPGAILEEALRHGARPVGVPAILRGAQVLPSPEASPRGAGWLPVGRLAERRHGLLVTDVAETALRLRG